MSLSSLLLRSQHNSDGTQIDGDLDAIFRSSAKSAAVSLPSSSRSDGAGVKRKSNKGPHIDIEDQRRVSKKKRIRNGVKDEEGGPRAEKVIKSGFLKKDHSKKAKKHDDTNESDTQPKDNPVLKNRPPSLGGKRKDNDDDSDGTDEEGDSSQLVHESLLASNKANRKGSVRAKSIYSPPEETPEQRDSRTIFIGNLPLEIAQKRPLLKRLRHHILARVGSAKIESIRFRSIPFQNPTAKLPNPDDSESTIKPTKRKAEGDSTPTKSLRVHDHDRINSWREKQGGNDDPNKIEQKTFLTPHQKRKIAYINQEFHSDADSINAYVVFTHPSPPESRPSNLPPPPPIMDPYEAARLAVEKCNGTMFMERRIRVDHVTKHDKNDKRVVGGDPKLSIFVGNLDFASKEDDLRLFFEGLVNSERGSATLGDNDDDDSDGSNTDKIKSWVTRVRIIREKDTQLGKGFAYVQFADRECVDEVLSLDATKLKFAKRTLRVQRCKTIPGSLPTPHASTSTRLVKPSSSKSPVLPKGDPTLGEKLAHLSKDARKQYKASDPDRVARRLAKKKARWALEKNGLKPHVKDRERVRKSSIAKKGRSVSQKATKYRVRSEKSLAKRNVKK